VFLYQVMPAMSDVPAAAFWSLSFWCGFVRRKHLPLVSGLAAAVAVLIRPNLILLTCVPAVAWLVKQRKDRTPLHDLWRDVARLGLGVSPALLLIAALNAYLYGAPWISGYGGFSSLYSFANLGTNLRHDARWFYEAQTLTLPLGLVLLAVPPKFYGSVRDGAPTRWGFIAAIALTMVSYAFYTPFDGWVFLRFLLPALPICAVVVAAAALRICRGVPPSRRAVAAAILCLPFIVNGVKFSRDRGVFGLRSFEGRFVEAARKVEALTPPNAIILAQMHSGSVRYYAHRITLRYDVLSPEWLDRALHAIAESGYSPYILLDDWEQRDFRIRFASTSAGKLDWAPIADIPGPINVRLYSGGPPR
jgi:hypothetical protein